MALVTGRVVFEQASPEFDQALLTVKLEDVSLTGMPSTLIASFTRYLEGYNNNALHFELTPDGDVPEINPRSAYAVSAHISLHPDDNPTDIRQGDYLSMQSYPVLTQSNPSIVEVEVKRIG